MGVNNNHLAYKVLGFLGGSGGLADDEAILEQEIVSWQLKHVKHLLCAGASLKIPHTPHTRSIDKEVRV